MSLGGKQFSFAFMEITETDGPQTNPSNIPSGEMVLRFYSFTNLLKMDHILSFKTWQLSYNLNR